MVFALSMRGPGVAPRSCLTSDLKIGTLMAVLPGGWHYRVSSRTGWPNVSVHDLVREQVCRFDLPLSVSAWEHASLLEQSRSLSITFCIVGT